MALFPSYRAIRAYVGLGSNLANPREQLERALVSLRRIPQTQWVTCSGIYQSAPLGPHKQPDFLNAVVALDTKLPPEELLEYCLAIEQLQGRRRLIRWAARTLDLDLLLYGDHRRFSQHLRLPHPGIGSRPFVLYPLAEIAPDLNIPGEGQLARRLSACSQEGLSLIVRREELCLES